MPCKQYRLIHKDGVKIASYVGRTFDGVARNSHLRSDNYFYYNCLTGEPCLHGQAGAQDACLDRTFDCQSGCVRGHACWVGSASAQLPGRASCCQATCHAQAPAYRAGQLQQQQRPGKARSGLSLE